MRLDQFLVINGIISGRDKAASEITKGNVSVNGRIITKPSKSVDASDLVVYSGDINKYVSRGSYKLSKALDEFEISVLDKICLDVGASTGGFTQILLEHGADKVYALDVGHNQLHETLSADERVINIEGFNFRDTENLKVKFNNIKFDLVVSDVSFISLRLLVDSFRAVSYEETDLVLLVKPQFEAGRGKMNKKGIVTDINVHREILINVLKDFIDKGFKVIRLTKSPITGSDGNIEYLLYLKVQSKNEEKVNYEDIMVFTDRALHNN